MSKLKDDNTRIVDLSIKYHCGYLEKELTKKISLDDISSWDSPCDLCGSHGSVEVWFKCECGKNHEIQIKSW